MNAQERYERIQRLFSEACALQESDRSEYLANECAADERIEVERLLKHDAKPARLVESADSGEAVHRLAAGVFGDQSTGDADTGDVASAALPACIGRYEVVRRIGHGGMGVVYEALQSEPRRRVALKVLRGGASSPAIVRRFRHEAQALAHLHHPGIAQVFDVGADDTGQPFIAMELIDGQPLLDFAATHTLDVPARLELIADICDAVHHAHQRGIIHRDLKPGNILVEMRDPSSAITRTGTSSTAMPGAIQPRILDFGIARITDDDLRSVTQQTTVGEVMGTVPYMSPEQTLGDPHALDTRSDVYSIGVIMFELLSGRLPIDVRQRGMHEAIRAVQHDEPLRLRALDRRIPDDVDTIAAKALEKDKTRRYQSAAELGADIRRALGDQPILARPASAMYQLRKFARRNRALAGGAAVGAIGLLLAASISTILAVMAVKAEREQRTARSDAEQARDEAEAASDFLADMLGMADPDRMGKDVRVVDVLAHSAAEIDARFPDNPAVRSHLHRNIGITYRQLGMLPEAETQLAAAVIDARAAYHPDHSNLMRALRSLAVLYDDQGRFDESIRMHEQILAIQQRTLGREHRDTLGTACNVGLTYFDLQRMDEARETLEATLAEMLRTLGPTDRFTLNCLQGLGSVHLHQQRFDDAAKAFQQVLDSTMIAIGPNDLRAIRACSSLSEVSIARGDAAKALEHVDDGLRRARVALPEDHWLIARMISLRGVYLHRLKRHEESEADLLKANAMYVQTFGVDDAMTQQTARSLVELYDEWNKPEAAAQWRAKVPASTSQPATAPAD